MLIPKKGYCIFKNQKLNPSCEKPALPRVQRCAEPGAVVLCWDFLDSGRLHPAGAQHTSVTAVNTSLLIPGFSHWTMVHASHPSPPPPCCHLRSGPTLNNFKTQESNIFSR